jgi:hypothetical protein
MFRQAKITVLQTSSKSRFSVFKLVTLALTAVLLLLVLSAYWLRNTLAIAVIEWQGADQQISAECLDFAVDWHLNVSVKKACLQTPHATITLQNAVWLRTAQDLSIEQVHVTHKVDKQALLSSNTASSQRFAPLPEILPTLSIKSLQVTSPYLAQPLSLEVRFNRQQELSLSGAIKAQLQWVDNAIRAKVRWSLAEIFAVVPQLQALRQQHALVLSDEILNAASFVTDIGFDGRQVRSTSQIQFNHLLPLNSCALDVDMQGRFGLNVDIQDPALPTQLDLRQLTTLVDIQTCEAIPKQYSHWPITRFKLRVPELITYEKGQINLPLTIVQWDNPEGKEHTSSVTLSSTKFAVDASFATNLAWQLNQYLLPQDYLQGSVIAKGSAQLNLDLQAGGKPLNWDIQQGRAFFVASDLHAAMGTLKNADSQFEFSASNSTGLQLKASTTIADIAAGNLTLGKWQSQVDANIDPQLLLKITSKHTMQDLRYQDGVSKTITANLNAALQALHSENVEQGWTAQDLSAQFNISTEHAHYQQNALKGLFSKGTVEGPSLHDLRIQMSTQLEKAMGNNWQLTGLANQLRFNIESLQQIYFQGKTSINSAQYTIAKNTDTNIASQKPQKIRLSELSVDHQGDLHTDLAVSQSTHDVHLLSGTHLQLRQDKREIQLQMSDQDVGKFQTVIKQVLPELVLSTGELSATLNANLDADMQVTGNIALKNLSGHYATTLFNGVQGETPFSLNSGGLQFASTTLRINSVNGGIPIDNLQATLQGTNNQILLEHGQGELLGGRFALNNLWLDTREQQFDISLTDLDLAKIVALQDQPGIKVTGSIGGKMPVNTNPQGINIENGRVVSNGGGTLTIKGNPAFDSIKGQQKELAFLENFTFSQLSSQVSLKPDGLMILNFAFTGINSDKKQALNFNYSHQENLFALLQTLNVARGIQDKIEQSITQGGKQ